MSGPRAEGYGVSVRMWTLLLPGASLASLALAAELFFRLLGYGQMVQYDFVPELGWVHGRNQHARMPMSAGGWPVHINSAGFRGPELSTEKSAGTLRVLLLGDSFTFGYGVADDSTLAMQLQREFAKAPPGCPRVQVVNGGVDGYNTEQEVTFLRRIGLAYHPDVVILGFNPNDIMSPEETRTMLRRPRLKQLLTRSALYQFLVPRLKSVVFRQEGQAYTRVLEDLFSGDSSVSWRVERVRSALVSLDSSGHEHGFSTAIAVFPFMDQVYGRRRGEWPPKALSALVQSPGIPVLDALPALRAAGQDGTVLFLDEPMHHPNPTALAVVSRELSRLVVGRGFVPNCVVGAPVQ